MINLTDQERDHLARVVSAGSAGFYLGDGLPVSTAIRLELAGFVTLTKEDDQRAIVTQQGVAHARRSVWA